MTLAAVVFDMDGLLVDSEPTWHAVERAFALDLGGSWTEADSLACIGQGVVSTARHMRGRFAPRLDVDAGARELVERFVAHVGDLRPKAGAADILGAARARGLPIALASSSSEQLIAAVLDAMGWAELFDALVSGETVARSKPAPDVFLEAARRLGVSPARAAALEDSLAGAQAAAAAGMLVVGVPEHHAVRSAMAGVAHHVVRDLVEARALLEL